jgi:hypothetical protein
MSCQDLSDLVMGVAFDAPRDDKYFVHGDSNRFYGKTFRDALHAAVNAHLATLKTQHSNAEKARALAGKIFPELNYDEKFGEEVGKLVQREIDKHLTDHP